MAKNTEMGLLLKIAGKLDKSFVGSLKTAEGRLGLLKSGAGAAGTAIGVGMAAVTTATIAAGKALYNLGASFDDAEDKIRIGTGATGEALDALMTNAKNVYSSVPASLEDTSTVISDYNTRLGLTGDNLEKLSTQALQVSSALGEDVSSVVENSSRAFKNFGVEEENMADAMDYSFKVSQSTGIGFNELLSTMQTGGAQLQAMGFSFNESATLLGQFTKGGYDASTMLMGLKTTAQQAIKDGFGSTSEAMNAYIEKIKNAKTDTEALAIANQKFGSRGGAVFVKAIKDGTLNIKELQAELENSDESISKAAEDTYDFGEKWTMFKNRMSVALQPMASSVFDQLGVLMDKLAPVLEEKILPLLGKFQPLVNQLLDLVEPLVDVVIQIVEALEPALQPIIDLVVALVAALQPLMQILSPIIEMLAKVVGWLAGGLAKGITSIVNALGFGKGGAEGEESEVPAMAEGGIVNKPTLAMIGEGGEPEAVIPLSKMANTNSITYSPVISINGDVSNDRAKEIAQITFEEFKKLYQRMMNENRRLSFATI